MPPRIKIRAPKRERPVDLAESWNNVLEPAVRQIYMQQSSATVSTSMLSFSTLYDASYRLVLQGHGKELYTTFVDYTHRYLQTLPHLAATTSDETMLATVSRMWQDFQVSLRLVGDIFMYLNRSYCNESGTPHTDQVGKQLFRDDVVASIMDQLFAQLLAQISAERNGEPVNSQILKSIVDMLKNLTDGNGENSASLFDTKFRPRLISSTIQEYETAIKNISSMMALERLRKIDHWLTNESKRGTLYLPEDTTAELLSTLEREILSKALPTIFEDPESGVVLWIARNDLDAFKLASALEVRSNANSLISLVSRELEREQQALNQTNDAAVEWVESSAILREKYTRLSDAVNRDSWQELETTHNRALSQCTKACEFLAKYLDEYLKKTSSLPAELVEPALNRAIVLFKAINDRDEFGIIFQRLLARRLLNNNSRSREHELSWLLKLRQEGYPDLFKFEKMMRDVDESRELLHGKNHISPDIIQTNVNVLSSNVWPRGMQAQSDYPVRLPQPIALAQEQFEDFYADINQKKTRRKLKWNLSMSNVDVKIRVGDKSYLASVPVLCMCILQLFSDDETYTAAELTEKTGIPLGGELERYLLSLSLAPGSKLLKKTPPAKEVLPTDSFSFNTEFSSPKSRIKVRTVSAKSTEGGITEKEDELLGQERRQKAGAAIVRVMKARGELAYAPLVQQVANILQRHFKASPVIIKKALQDLLDKGYLERSDSDKDLFRYVS